MPTAIELMQPVGADDPNIAAGDEATPVVEYLMLNHQPRSWAAVRWVEAARAGSTRLQALSSSASSQRMQSVDS